MKIRLIKHQSNQANRREERAPSPAPPRDIADQLRSWLGERRRKEAQSPKKEFEELFECPAPGRSG
jgi:hypothetical protein